MPPLPLAAALMAIVLPACGGGDEPQTPAPPSLERWQAQVGGLCSDGTQEAVALPLPQSVAKLADDAAARAEILAGVRDGILALTPPEGVEDEVAAYLGELEADVRILRRIARAAREGHDHLRPLGRLDESAGSVALELDLEDCAALANAIARTP